MSTPRFSPVWLVLVGILSVQFGAVISKGLFGEIPPVGMVFLRLITSSLILLAFGRPRLRGRPVNDWWPVLALGFALGAMNWAFYESFARIPLGVAVTIEFAGPLLLAAVGSRRPRDLVWVGLAALGITLFGAGPTKVDAVGFGLALLAGGCWALYIVSTAATGRRWAGVEGLAVASTIATLAIAPFAVVPAGERLLEPRLLVLGALVGLLSSVVPYSLEMVALRTLPPRVFGILMSLEPAVAALAAAIAQRVAHAPATAGDGVCDSRERGRRPHRVGPRGPPPRLTPTRPKLAPLGTEFARGVVYEGRGHAQDQ